MYRSLAFAFAFVMTSLGCAGDPTLVRTMDLTSSEAAVLGDRVHVVARDGEKVSAEIKFKPGETIPGEGVVRVVPDTAMTAGGTVMLLAGLGTIAGGFGVGASCHSTGWEMFGCMGEAMGALGMVTGGALLGVAGIVVMALGARGHVTLEQTKSARVRLTPSGLQF